MRVLILSRIVDVRSCGGRAECDGASQLQLRLLTFTNQPETCDLRVQRRKPRRPSSIRVLGLLPPYSVTDVKKAFHAKAARLHPDAGGDPAEFKALHFAYERALDHARFQDSRREWLGSRIERYAAREFVINQIRNIGGTCRIGALDDYLDEFGSDFAEVVRELIAVEISGPNITDDTLSWIDSVSQVGPEVRTLAVRNANISSKGLMRLAAFDSIRALDLRGTAISEDGLEVLSRFGRLEWLHLGKTGVGYFTRRRLKRDFPRINLVTRSSVQPPSDDYWDEYRSVMRRLGNL